MYFNKYAMCIQENSVVYRILFDDYLKVIIFRTKYDNLFIH